MMRHVSTRTAAWIVALTLGIVGAASIARAAPVAQHGISLFKLAAPASAPVNGESTFAIIVQNTSDVPQRAIVEDDVPASLEILHVWTNQGLPCSVSGQRVQCVIDLPPTSGETINVQVRVRPGVAPGTRLINTATANGVSARASLTISDALVTPRPLPPTPSPWPTVPPTLTPLPTWTPLPSRTPAPPSPGITPSATATPWPTSTPEPSPYGGVWLAKSVSLSTVALGQSFTWYIEVNSGDPNPQAVRVLDPVGWPEVETLEVRATQGSCVSGPVNVDCTVTTARGSPARIFITQRARTDRNVAGRRLTNVANGFLRGSDIRSNAAYVQIADHATPITSPTTAPPGSGPTALPPGARPTSTPPWNPTATATIRPTSVPPGITPTATEPAPGATELLAVRPSTPIQAAPPLNGPVSVMWDVFIGAGVPAGSLLVLPANAQSRIEAGGLVCQPAGGTPVSAPWTDALACRVTPGQRLRMGLQLFTAPLWAAGTRHVWPLTLQSPDGVNALAQVAAAFTLIASPTPTPTEDILTSGAACARAVRYALSKQGALYSQGGALAADPIDPATGRPYPRTGPNSFDCSGLVYAAYRSAGVTLGTTTYTQVFNGWSIPCTLANLRGSGTTCWAPGDLIFLRYGGSASGPGSGAGQHVAIYVGNGLFMDCYNHRTGCILHDVTRDSFYQRYFWQARRVVSGCEGMTLDPGQPGQRPVGPPQDDTVCVPGEPEYPDTGVNYMRGCGPPVLPDDGSGRRGTRLSQFDGIVGWIGPSGRPPPPDAEAHLEFRIRLGGEQTDMCRWPHQLDGYPVGVPPGGDVCSTIWADPLAFLPQANGDTLMAVNGTPVPAGWNDVSDPAYSETIIQLPPPGHPATLMFRPPDGDPGGVWWSPGNDERARDARCPLGGPKIRTWFDWLITFLFGWLFGC